MSLYQTLVLLHVVATGGLFAGLGVEVTALHRLQRAATVDEARAWLPSLQHPAGMLPHLSMVVLVVTGLGLAAQRGSLAAWMTAALVAIVLMVLLTVTLTGAPLSALAASLAAEGGDPAAGWSERARDPDLHWSMWLRVGLYVGVLGLMVLEPGVTGSVATLLCGAAVGAGAALLARPRAPVAVLG